MTDAEYSSWVSTGYLTPTHADRRLTSSGSTYNIAVEPRLGGYDLWKISIRYTRGGGFNTANKIQKFAMD